MCQGCWRNDHGAPMINTEEVLVAAELIRRLYEDHKQYLGGPLHAMLDDMNIDDEQIESSYYTNGDYAKRTTFEGVPDGTGRWVHHDDLDCTPEVKELCELILHAFRQMSESHRAAAIGWYQGWAIRHAEALADSMSASEARSDDTVLLVAEWTAAKNAPPVEPGATKACVSIPCPPFTGQLPEGERPVRFSGVIYPNIGSAFGLDAQIVGPGVVETQPNPDGSVTVTWERDVFELPYWVTDTSFGFCATGPGVGLVQDALDDPRQIRPIYPDAGADS